MAITPRTILTNPMSAGLLAASMLATAAVGMFAVSFCESNCSASYQVPQDVVFSQHNASPCEDVRLDKIADKTRWSEYDWFEYAKCFERERDSQSAIDVSTQGLNYFPRSEALYNLKGYHLITLHKYEDAVKTLEVGLERVGVASDGTLSNNLAWAGLWVPREMDLERARNLYTQSLAREPGVCEALHTGLWVEYAIARESRGLERARALRNFSSLQHQYEPCHDRLDDGNREALLEVMGAAVIIHQVDKELSSGFQGIKGTLPMPTHLVQEVAVELRKNHRGASIDALCREASPLATAHHTCVEMIDASVTTLRNQERAGLRAGQTPAFKLR